MNVIVKKQNKRRETLIIRGRSRSVRISFTIRTIFGINPSSLYVSVM